MKKFTNIKLCVFDAYGTLFDINSVTKINFERLGDIAGAKSFGFNVSWINRFNSKKEVLPFKPDIELKSLIELPNVI